MKSKINTTKQDRLVIKQTTIEDLRAFYGDELKANCRAWSAFVDGNLICIGGVSLQREYILGFMDIRSEETYPARMVWRGSMKVWNKVKKLGYSKLYAVADTKYPTSSAYLERLGFEFLSKGDEGDMYIWQESNAK